jgi:hypothetical protein
VLPLGTGSQTKGVTVDGGEVAKSKVGATLAFGVLGDLAAKGAMDRAFLAIYRNDGATAHFQIDHLSPQSLRAQLAPILFKVGVPFSQRPILHRTKCSTSGTRGPSISS